MSLSGILRRLSTARSGNDIAQPSEAYDHLYTNIATEEDIFNCFKLLLGRTPGKKEWHGHRLSAGGDLEAVVKKFMNSDEFKRRKLTVKSMSETAHEIVDLGDMKICISSTDEVCGQLRTAKVYEPGVTSVIQRTLKPGMTFVDIGANIGYFSVMASKLVGDQGRVIGVEPYPYNIKLLQKNISLNGCTNVEVLPFALTDKKGFLTYDDSAGNSGNVIALGEEFSALLESTLVYCVKLDDVLEQGTQVDLIKMDIEGAEPLALKGMQQLISEQAPTIISEVSEGFLRHVSNTSMQDYLAALMANELYQIAVIISPENIIECGRDIDKVIEIYAGVDSMCMDVVVYTADKESTLFDRQA